MQSFKKILLPILIVASSGAVAEDLYSPEEREQILTEIPVRLATSWPEVIDNAYVLACTSSANQGDDGALAALVIMADSAEIIQKRIGYLDDAKATSQNDWELYKKMDEFNTAENFKKMHTAAKQLPNAIEYCRQVNDIMYQAQGMEYDPLKELADKYKNDD